MALIANPWFFCILIVVFAATSTWTILRPMWRGRVKLDRFLERTQPLSSPQLSELSDLDPLLDEAGLTKLWSAYRAAVSASPSFSPPRPLDFFDRQAILDAYCNRHAAELVPGRLTALGVLGTFVGLIYGLSQLDTTTDAGIRSSIDILMDGMGTAFWSSIAGIIASVGWAFADRVLLQQLDLRIYRFQNRISDLLPFEPTEDLLRQLVDYQKEHLESFKHFTSDVLITQVLDPHFQQMRELVAKLGDQSVESQTETLSRMVTEFVNRLNDAFGGQIQELANTMKELTEWQRATKAELADLIESIRQQAEQQQEILERSRGLLEGVTELSGNLGATLEQFHERAAALHQAMEATTSSFSNAVAQLETVNTLAAEHLQRMAAAHGQAAALLSRLSGELDAQSQRMDQLATRMSEQIDRLARLLEREVQGAVNHMHDGLAATLGEFDKALADATRRLREVVQTLYETLSDLPDEAGRIGNSVRVLRDTMAQAAEGAHHLLEMLQLQHAQLLELAVQADQANHANPTSGENPASGANTVGERPAAATSEARELGDA